MKRRERSSADLEVSFLLDKIVSCASMLVCFMVPAPILACMFINIIFSLNLGFLIANTCKGQIVFAREPLFFFFCRITSLIKYCLTCYDSVY